VGFKHAAPRGAFARNQPLGERQARPRDLSNQPRRNLAGLPDFDLGVGLSVRPAVVSRARTPEPGVSTEYDSDISLDMTQKLGPNLLSALTVNTDFAETEVDVRQINLTRFPVFFPEKRSFFLEGADIFDFGLGLDEDNLLPFFSRRIGLYGDAEADQTPIPINVGGKINGRMGSSNVGALIANTRKVDEFALTEDTTITVEPATMGTLRLKQNVLEESLLGMLATFGDQQGRSTLVGGRGFYLPHLQLPGRKDTVNRCLGLAQQS
jgi:hypothetical protein